MAKSKVKSKSAQKSASKQKRNSNELPQLPTGYKTIGRAPNWDVDKAKIIEGERSRIKNVTMYKGTPDEYQTRTMIVHDKRIGSKTVWESRDLEDLFDQSDEGDIVRIEFKGTLPAKKGMKPQKLFACGIKE